MKLELNTVIDAACPPLAAMSERGNLPETMFVHPAVHDTVARLRRHELDNGFPLMFLGMRLKADADLPIDGFRFQQ